MKKRLLFSSLFTSLLMAAEPLQESDIALFLHQENPFIQDIFKAAQSSLHEVTYTEGSFDTQFLSSYHKKSYPATEGEFSEVAFKQSFQSGIALESGWRQALETQEYNNIKTGDRGEVRLGMHFDAIAMVLGTNKEKFALQNAKLTHEKELYGAQRMQQNLEVGLLKLYYELRYYRSQILLLEELLTRVQNRESFILRRIDSGTLAPLEHVELNQQIIAMKQRVLGVETTFQNRLNYFLQFLGLSKEAFEERYTIEALEYEEPLKSLDASELFAKALSQRPDYLALTTQEEQLYLANDLAEILKYPTFKVGAYATHDFSYEDAGYKVTFDLSFPLQQSAYEGRNGVVGVGLQTLGAQKSILEHAIRNEILHAMNQINMLQESIVLASQEVELLKRLEDAEYKRYEAGSSELFRVTQRESARLEAQTKLLGYKLQEIAALLDLKLSLGASSFE